MPVSLNATALEVTPSIKPPSVIRRIELNRLLLEQFEPETGHIPYQDYRPQMRVLLRRFLNAGIPDLQYLVASFLNVGKEILIAGRENRAVPTGNQTYAGRRGVFGLHRFGRPSG